MEAFGWHLITFLSGVAVGAGGTYFAEKYTDRRREGEARRRITSEFSRLRALMPKLFEEMRTDLKGDATGLVRELVLLPSKNVMFNSNRPRFAYFESEHSALREQLSHLEQAGLVLDVMPGNAPVFRMQESFVALLVSS
jgi:hypothetical protein